MGSGTPGNPAAREFGAANEDVVEDTRDPKAVEDRDPNWPYHTGRRND